MNILKDIHPSYPIFVASGICLGIGIATRSPTFRSAFLIPIAANVYAMQRFSPNLLTLFHNILLATAIDYLLLTDVQREVQLQTRGVNDDDKTLESIRDLSLMKRYQWALHLQFSPRGIGWKHGYWANTVPSIYEDTESRSVFFRSRLRALILNLVSLYISSHFIEYDTFLRAGVTSFSQQTMLQRSRANLIILAHFTAFLSLAVNIVPGLVAVAAGLTEPRDWPWMFGNFTDAYTVGRFWRYTWHQLLRRIVTSLSKFITEKVLRLGPKATVTRCFKVFLSFILSGAMHICVPSSSVPMAFFTLQGVVVILEGFLITMLSQTTASRWFSHTTWHRMGWVWVWCWFAWSSSSALDWWVMSGHAAIPMHVFRFLSLSN